MILLNTFQNIEKRIKFLKKGPNIHVCTQLTCIAWYKYFLLNDRSVITAKSQTEALMY